MESVTNYPCILMMSVLILHTKTAVGKLDNMENRYRYITRSSYHFACFTTGGISVLVDMNLAQYATKPIVALRTALFWVVKQVAAYPYDVSRQPISPII